MESLIQSKIIKELEKNGWYQVKIISCNKNGFPDIIAFKKGYDPLFIEVKTNKGKQSELQKYRQYELQKQGFDYHIVRSVENLKIILDTYNHSL
jgi:Holliday junction resolvase